MPTTRKAIQVIILATITCVFLLLLYSVVTKSNHKKRITERLGSIPEFEFYQLNDSSYTQKDLNKSQATVFIYFHVDCDFCEHESGSIATHLHEFKDTQLLFISIEEESKIKQFAEKYSLLNRSGVIFLQDKKDLFPEVFDIKSVPSTLVYDRHGKLRKRFNGQTLAPTILKALQHHEE
jgi:peroxiredoxin